MTIDATKKVTLHGELQHSCRLTTDIFFTNVLSSGLGIAMEIIYLIRSQLVLDIIFSTVNMAAEKH